jgi:hypothetical protein
MATARRAVSQAVEAYNTLRPHRSLGLMKPEEKISGGPNSRAAPRCGMTNRLGYPPAGGQPNTPQGTCVSPGQTLGGTPTLNRQLISGREISKTGESFVSSDGLVAWPDAIIEPQEPMHIEIPLESDSISSTWIPRAASHAACLLSKIRNALRYLSASSSRMSWKTFSSSFSSALSRWLS